MTIARRHRPVAAVAALPMYDLPELREANDQLWSAIARRLKARGVRAPARLSRDEPLENVWRNPDLLLAQTCGYPLAKQLKGAVRVLATPRYRAAGCDGALHRSAILVRAEDPAANLADLRGQRCALNDPASNTGMNLLRAEIAPLAGGERFFRSVVLTGAHVASAQAVIDGDADVAAVDCVTWAHIQRHRPTLAGGLRVLAWTAATPGLPLIASAALPASVHATTLAVLDEVATDPALRSARQALLLDGFDLLPAAHYRAVVHLEDLARGLAYPKLH
ncbi:phosphate/phosphite/phosphonate ABC transporter substrate-binding protein [Caulobacter radicis]|uniref:Phosphate ABC transporter substrate-binding protein n=1 Tax=Caulobacter radicis TaxID=2172650 RepID=A0A2T9JQP6_9CAUL|nr:PhnD/SsuA/transferrin family substrate-binding protein [Caulobacter radicis]PVM86013.1 hypothetical protein DDF65_06210 [Caulobacter radicis]